MLSSSGQIRAVSFVHTRTRRTSRFFWSHFSSATIIYSVHCLYMVVLLSNTFCLIYYTSLIRLAGKDFTSCMEISVMYCEYLTNFYDVFFFSVISVVFFGDIQTSAGGKWKEEPQPPSFSTSKPGWASMVGSGQEEGQSLEWNATDCAVNTKQTPGSIFPSRTFCTNLSKPDLRCLYLSHLSFAHENTHLHRPLINVSNIIGIWFLILTSLEVKKKFFNC